MLEPIPGIRRFMTQRIECSRARRNALCGSLALACALSPIAAAQTHDTSPQYTFQLPGMPALFGRRVALDGDFAVVASHNQGVFHEGAVIVYRRGVAGYDLQQILSPIACYTGPSDPYVNGSGLTACLFGLTVDVSDSRIAVGSGGGDFLGGGPVGLIHIYVERQGHWEVEDILRGLVNPSGAPGTAFSSEFDLDGDTLICGASTYWFIHPGFGIELGAVFVYERRPTGHWELAQLIESPPYAGTAPGYGEFGRSVALDGDTFIASDHSQRSLVHVYNRSAGVWTLTQTIERAPTPPMVPTYYGREVALDSTAGVLAIVEGAVCHVYERDHNGVWSKVTTLWQFAGTPTQVGTQFGNSVAIRGDLIAIGAPYEAIQGVARGVVELFRRGPAGWARVGLLGPPPNATYAGLGKSVALADGRVLAGDEGPYGGTGLVPGRACLWELPIGSEVCTGAGNTVDLHVMFQDHQREWVDLAAHGLTGPGVGYFVAGDPGPPMPFGAGGLCVQQARRISGPFVFEGPTERAYATVMHPDPTSPHSTAFQFVYGRRGPGSFLGASIARVVD